MTIRFALAAACAALLAACGPHSDAPGADGAATSAAEAEATGERFYERERFTIKYALKGMQTGEAIEHVRDWGRLRAEIEESAVSVMGITENTSSRRVMEGEDIYTIAADGSVSVMANPIYGELTEEMKGKSGVEFGFELLKAMGGKPTGESGSFAGEACDYWEIAELSTRTCVTDWGATLYSSASMAGLGAVERVATEVRVGDGGPDSAFAVDKSKATRVEMPDGAADAAGDLIKDL